MAKSGMTTTCAVLPLAWLLGVSPALARCTADLAFYNLNRTTHGEINVECSWPHSVPFGNWGVDSNYDSREDGNQFRGWKWQSDGTREWNSCTKLRNRDDFQEGATMPEQWADPGYTRVYGVARIRGPRGETCASWLPGRVFAIANPFMRIYELDWPDADDWVAHLAYDHINIRVTCSGYWYCTGWSTVRSPIAGDSVVTADIQVFVRMYRR